LWNALPGNKASLSLDLRTQCSAGGNATSTWADRTGGPQIIPSAAENGTHMAEADTAISCSGMLVAALLNSPSLL
jgi:hypothetical protein